jgi:hypothetical protein
MIGELSAKVTVMIQKLFEGLTDRHGGCEYLQEYIKSLSHLRLAVFLSWKSFMDYSKRITTRIMAPPTCCM